MFNPAKFHASLREGSSKRADFFRYKDHKWAGLTCDMLKKAFDDIVAKAASNEDVENSDLYVEFNKLTKLFIMECPDNDLAWDKARESVDKIADMFEANAQHE